MRKKRALWAVGFCLLILPGLFPDCFALYAGSNQILQFAAAAAPWLLSATGLACSAASRSES